MNYRKINNLTGWIVGAIAYIVYLMTMEATASFWDCGEFLSCAYKLEVGHSPGAPFFMLVQRIFSLLAGHGASTGAPSVSTLGVVGAATYINSLSALTSALSILFLFWSISHFARKLLVPGNTEPARNQAILIMGAAMVGALAYTFSDTFWFSAVEAEVYGTSSFFTAITFWAALKWENVADNKHADRWLVLIAYLIGVSVCVHLLNLLTIPAVAMIYYFRRYPATWLGTAIAFVVGCVVLAFVQFGIIQYIPRIASNFDIMFTNSFGAHFDTGATTFLVLLAVILVGLLVVAKMKKIYVLQIATLCTIFIIIGYSAYFSAIIRSRADVPIDMTNPDNPNSFLDYVDREQFGQQPIFFGPYFTSQYDAVDTSEKIFTPMLVNGKDKYVNVGKKMTPLYPGEQTHFFPRVYDANDPAHVSYYRSFLGLGPKDEPTGLDNIKYFLGYQMNWMYWRYFMWNFAGRENDIEGQGDPQRANWISGIPFVDEFLGRGNTDKMGSGYSDNGAHNKLYFLPLILGILGLVYQFNRNKKDGIIILTFFFFTGAAIGIYLNMPPLQPRERDYAFAGCTYAFAMWIGLGVLMVHQWVMRSVRDPMAAIASISLCTLAVPILMAEVEWDDHDRSKKTLPRAVAYNTLSCCDSNAVLFTFGDNQTYPLWYIQEVEGFRKDVRIINTSLLGIDWYIDQLNYRINDADAVPMIWKKDDYIGDHHNYVRYSKNPQIAADKYFNLTDICNFVDSKDPANMASNGYDQINYIPAKNFFTPGLNKDELIQRGWVNPSDSARLVTEMKFSFPKGAATKSDLAILNIIAAVSNQGWKRPLYFDAGLRSGDYAGTGDYLHLEGLVYHLLPYKYNDPAKSNPQVLGTINTDKSFDLFMHTFIWGGADRNDVYFDEPNRHDLYSYRMDASFLANSLTAEGKKDKAIQVLDKVMAGITEHSYYYDLTGYFLAAAYYRAGAIAKGNALSAKMVRNAEDDINWIVSLSDNGKAEMADEVKQQFQIMQGLSSTAYQSGDSTTAKQIYGRMQMLGPKVKDLLNTRNGPAGGEEEEE
jgi:hypothetical protein